MQDYNSAFSYIAALTQSDPTSTVVDVRMIHDTNKAVAAIPRRDTLPNLWNEIVGWNNLGYGVYVSMNELDGNGREIANVCKIRCQAIDLDNISAVESYNSAISFNPAPSFAVQSSPGKFHVYWQTVFHTNRDGFSLLQRKLRTLFNGDKTVIDASRVLRLPGTYHLKAAPHLVTCWSLTGFNRPVDPSILEVALANVNVIDGSGGRHDLGEPSLQAPGLDWCIQALRECDPNSLDRGEWISFTSAFKQAGWNFAPEQQLFELWAQWCLQYVVEDGSKPTEAYLRKNWNSIRNTEIGWPTLERRNGNLHAMRLFGQRKIEFEQPQPQPRALSSDVPTQPIPGTMPLPLGEFLTDTEQQQLFAGCMFITRMGEILTPSGRFMNSTKFNGTFGGHKFLIDAVGKQTTEPWVAATRSTLWTIPKADHIRFIPKYPYGELVSDALGRIGVNTYKPAIIQRRTGDISPFLKHVEMILPMDIDRRILFEYLAHIAKFPGYKIPWAPLIQSEEGVGKNVIKYIMTNAIGSSYVYFPTAQQLINSGSKFNAWMRSKLFILVDEIKVDERRDMIEILKPMISEETIEVQAKGIDQDIEDNPANWLFFSNFKDAIPITKNSRRFAIFYSQIQSQTDLLARGMDTDYFRQLYAWIKQEGAAYVTEWLLNYPVEREAIPMRAPITTSTHEAVRQSHGPVETLILDAVQDGLPGFRGGWISSQAVFARLKGTPIRHVSSKVLGTILATLGYHLIGRATRAYFVENKDQRSDLYNTDRGARVEDFERLQGQGYLT